jgi:hypothetical protein
MGGLFQRGLWPAVLAAAALALVACSYGTSVNNSGFESAAVSLDGRVLVVAYHQLNYRPATGLAAFPDGGVPQYDRDRIVLAKAPAYGSGIEVIRVFTADGLPGSGHMTIRAQPGDPQHMLVILTDQSSSRDPLRVRRWRLGLEDGRLEPLPDVDKELAMVGRRLGAKEFGDLRLAAEDGSLLLGVTGADGEALWLRTAGGRLHPLDPLTHFYGQVGDEVYLWSGDEGLVHNWRTGERRVIARYDPAKRITSTLIRDDPTVAAVERANRSSAPGAAISSDRQSITIDGAVTHLDMAALRR